MLYKKIIVYYDAVDSNGEEFSYTNVVLILHEEVANKLLALNVETVDNPVFDQFYNLVNSQQHDLFENRRIARQAMIEHYRNDNVVFDDMVKIIDLTEKLRLRVYKTNSIHSIEFLGNCL